MHSRLAGTTVKAESHNAVELLISLYMQPVGWGGETANTPALSQNLFRGNACVSGKACQGNIDSFRQLTNKKTNVAFVEESELFCGSFNQGCFAMFLMIISEGPEWVHCKKKNICIFFINVLVL